MEFAELTDLLKNLIGKRVTVYFDNRPDMDEEVKYPNTGMAFGTYIGTEDGTVCLSYKGSKLTINDILKYDKYKERSNGTTIEINRVTKVEENKD